MLLQYFEFSSRPLVTWIGPPFDSSEMRLFLLREKLWLLIDAVLRVKFRRVVLEVLEVCLTGLVVPELRAIVLVCPAIKVLPQPLTNYISLIELQPPHPMSRGLSMW